MQMKNILWPSDLSETANLALPYVQNLAQAMGAQVHLLYVAQDLNLADHWYGDADKKMLAQMQERECDFAQGLLQKACSQDLPGCPAFQHHVRKGDPAKVIVEFAKEKGIDAIVMATHGRGHAEEDSNYFGSVADRVTRNSPVPVLVVPTHTRP